MVTCQQRLGAREQTKDINTDRSAQADPDSARRDRDRITHEHKDKTKHRRQKGAPRKSQPPAESGPLYQPRTQLHTPGPGLVVSDR